MYDVATVYSGAIPFRSTECPCGVQQNAQHLARSVALAQAEEHSYPFSHASKSITLPISLCIYMYCLGSVQFCTRLPRTKLHSCSGNSQLITHEKLNKVLESVRTSKK